MRYHWSWDMLDLEFDGKMIWVALTRFVSALRRQSIARLRVWRGLSWRVVHWNRLRLAWSRRVDAGQLSLQQSWWYR